MNFSQLFIKLSGVSTLTSLLVLITSFMLGRLMTIEHFGSYSFLQSVLTLLINILPFGSTLAIAIFINKGTKLKVSKVLDNALFILMPTIFITLFIVWLVGAVFFKSFEIVFLIIIVNSVLMSVNLLFISYLRATQQVRKYAKHFLLYTFSITIVGVLGYVLYQEILAFYLTVSLGLLLPFFISIRSLYIEFTIGTFKRKKRAYFSWSLKYGMPIVASTTVMSFLIVGDKILLGVLADKSTVASYSISALLASTTLFIVNNFAATWSSYLFRKLPKLTPVGCYEYYVEYKYKAFIALPFSFIIYSAQVLLYRLFFSSKYPDLELSIFLLNLSYTLLGISKYFMGYLNYYNKNFYIFYSAVASAFILILSSFFTFSNQLFGLSISVFFAFVMLLLLTMTFTDRVLINNVNK